MSKKNYPSVEYVRQCLREENGRLFWLERPREHFADDRRWKGWNTAHSGKEAGHASVMPSGTRWIVVIDQRRFYRNVIVYSMHAGQWHKGIDHENRNKLDDRIENLRPATQALNNANTEVRRNSSSGIKGVRLRPRMKAWTAQISINGKSRYLGSFPTPEEAHAAYVKAAREQFGEFHSAG